MTVLPINDEDLSDLETLMERYRDRPMDFADATLVHLDHEQFARLTAKAWHGHFSTHD